MTRSPREGTQNVSPYVYPLVRGRDNEKGPGVVVRQPAPECSKTRSFQHLEYLLGDEVHARLVEVVAVVGQQAAALVVLVVLFPVVNERLAQVVERDLLLL